MRCRPHLSIAAYLCSVLAVQPAPAAVSPLTTAAICDQAAAYAAQQTGVPISVLQAISLNETGKKRNGTMRPWPWTVNMEGKGVWFDTQDAARAYVYQNYKRGARSFDVGCFQINFKWHGKAFSSIEEMFDPKPNALYAARFLLDLYAEKGSWSAAAGAYHSRTPKYADRYRKRFERFRAALAGKTAPQMPSPPIAPVVVAQAAAPIPRKPRVNLYPLLQANSSRRSLGSLVPLGAVVATRRLIDARASDG